MSITVTLLLVFAIQGTAWVQPTSTHMVEMSDGTDLATDVYLPTTDDGPWPVVLVRTPYNRAALTVEGNNLSSNGIATVVQDNRGRFGSEGVDCIFRCDGSGALQDGVNTLDWIHDQPWSNGHLVTWGGSALGIVQYLLASSDPVGLDAMWVTVATPTMYDHGFFQGGVYREALIDGWLAGQESTFFLDEIALHPLDGDFWTPLQTADRFSEVNAPAVHVGGWYDIFSQGTIDAFVGYQNMGGDGARDRQLLVMGPWAHAIQQREVGELTYPANARDIPSTFDDLFLLWFTHYLGITPNSEAVAALPAVQYYVMGDVDDPAAPGNEWRTSGTWPITAAPIRLYLHPDGLLAEDCPVIDTPTSVWIYDPEDPSPTVGGANLVLPAGPYDQSAIEERSDTVVFSTLPLESPQEITGRLRAHLFVSIDTPDSDIMVRITDVYPDGRSMLVLDGAQRLATIDKTDAVDLLEPDEVVEAVVDLWSTSIVIDTGHRIRISITSSNWPRFRANPNDGSNYGEEAAPRAVTATLHHNTLFPSYLELPCPARDMADVDLCEEHPAEPDVGEVDDVSDEAEPLDGDGAGDGTTGDMRLDGIADEGANPEADEQAQADEQAGAGDQVEAGDQVGVGARADAEGCGCVSAASSGSRDIGLAILLAQAVLIVGLRRRRSWSGRRRTAHRA